MWIKLCANTNLADAQLAAELGADAVGFVFAPSKRQVTAGQVAAITPHLPDTVEKVGVFVPEQASMLEDTVRQAGLTAVQLHGEFAAAAIERLVSAFEGRLKLLQVVHFNLSATDASAAERAFRAAVERAAAQPALWAILLDAARNGASGGLGLSFPWSSAAAIVREVCVNSPLPRVIVAGGLHAGNVAEAIATFAPFGVDVASGVESSPGRKDLAKTRAFLATARGSANPVG